MWGRGLRIPKTLARRRIHPKPPRGFPALFATSHDGQGKAHSWKYCTADKLCRLAGPHRERVLKKNTGDQLCNTHNQLRQNNGGAKIEQH
jgi:hypothetical protein